MTTLTTTPRWIILAEQFIGLREVPGEGDNPEIVQMWKDIRRGGIKKDTVAWCSAFVGAMLERSGVVSSRFESAASYLKWGKPLVEPVYGCIVVFKRDGGGHVGFVVGRDIAGNLLVLGGNQSDAVNIKAFPTTRVVGYRWPINEPLPTFQLTVGTAALSTGEA